MAEQVENIKWVPNTLFMVDGFRFQTSRCKHYWLSHYHSDHTIGNWALLTRCLVHALPWGFTIAIQVG